MEMESGSNRKEASISSAASVSESITPPAASASAPFSSQPSRMEQSSSSVLLEVQACAVSVGARQLFEPVSFSVQPGDLLFIQGENGAGKSTLLRALLGKDPAWTRSGSVAWKLPVSEVGYLPQMAGLNFFIPLALRETVALACPKADEAVVERILSRDEGQKSWNSASGGERQKALMARTLADLPRVVLLDEPTNHLDQKSKQAFYALLEDYVKGSFGFPGAAVVVSHEVPPENLKNRARMISLQNSLNGAEVGAVR